MRPSNATSLAAIWPKPKAGLKAKEFAIGKSGMNPIWNQFWNGSVAEYYRLMQVAYNTIKAQDPQAKVLFGGLAFFEDPDFLESYLALAENNEQAAYFDILSYHYYWSIYDGGNLVQPSQTTPQSASTERYPHLDHRKRCAGLG